MYPKPHFVDVCQDVIVPCLLTAAQHNTRTTHSLDPRPLPEFWEQRKNEHGVAYFVASLAAYSHVVLTSIRTIGLRRPSGPTPVL